MSSISNNDTPILVVIWVTLNRYERKLGVVRIVLYQALFANQWNHSWEVVVKELEQFLRIVFDGIEFGFWHKESTGKCHIL